MQYSDDIEMWDFEQILDSSPLTALTADFARFKQRFTRIFESNGNIPYADSDSEEAVMASNNRQTAPSVPVKQDNRVRVQIQIIANLHVATYTV